MFLSVLGELVRHVFGQLSPLVPWRVFEFFFVVELPQPLGIVQHFLRCGFVEFSRRRWPGHDDDAMHTHRKMRNTMVFEGALLRECMGPFLVLFLQIWTR